MKQRREWGDLFQRIPFLNIVIDIFRSKKEDSIELHGGNSATVSRTYKTWPQYSSERNESLVQQELKRREWNFPSSKEDSEVTVLLGLESYLPW